MDFLDCLKKKEMTCSGRAGKKKPAYTPYIDVRTSKPEVENYGKSLLNRAVKQLIFRYIRIDIGIIL
jgi:hypothetical protein